MYIKILQRTNTFVQNVQIRATLLLYNLTHYNICNILFAKHDANELR